MKATAAASSQMKVAQESIAPTLYLKVQVAGRVQAL